MESKQVQHVVTSENLQEFNLARLHLASEVQEPQANEEKEVDKAKESPKSGKNAASVTEKVDSEGDHEENEEESTGHGKPRHKNGIQKRFSEITADRNEARRLAAESKAENEALRKRLEALESVGKPTEKTGKPNPDSFKDPFEYAEALSDWKVTQKLQERDEADRQRQAKESAQRQLEDWKERVKAASKDLEDYDEVMADANFMVTDELQQAMLDSPVGPNIEYYFAKNPDASAALTKMKLGKMLREFGKLEAKLDREDNKGRGKSEAETETVKLAVKRTVATPPEPITPIKTAGSSAGAGLVDSNGVVNGSYQEYRAARKAGKIK